MNDVIAGVDAYELHEFEPRNFGPCAKGGHSGFPLSIQVLNRLGLSSEEVCISLDFFRAHGASCDCGIALGDLDVDSGD